jgi:hypothetical protein
LAQVDYGSGGAIAIGTEPAMTRGFAEQWLAWQDSAKAKREHTFRRNQIFWTRWASFAGSVAAAAIGWALISGEHPFLNLTGGYCLRAYSADGREILYHRRRDWT